MEFFKYFFRVLHEISSSSLKLFRVFRLHPVYIARTDCTHTETPKHVVEFFVNKFNSFRQVIFIAKAKTTRVITSCFEYF
jgi:hypothetical protein